MAELGPIDYSTLDRPEVLQRLFHPRAEYEKPVSGSGATDILIPVAEGVRIGARFHITDKTAPNILFFHGNGEIVSDYDDFGPVYNRMGINFLPVDYRGYGRSNGNPTVSDMMGDAVAVFEFARRWLAENGCTGPLVVMGRSLGSASALELASRYPDAIAGLIVESGFAYAGPLLALLGVRLDSLEFDEAKGFRNIDKIREFNRPVLVIHAEHDHIIPFSDGQALYSASVSRDKTLLKIPQADHNTIFAYGLREYMAAVRSFADRVIRDAPRKCSGPHTHAPRGAFTSRHLPSNPRRSRPEVQAMISRSCASPPMLVFSESMSRFRF